MPPSNPPSSVDDLLVDYVDESLVSSRQHLYLFGADVLARHIEAFANALQAEDIHDEVESSYSQHHHNRQSSTPQSPQARVRKVSALSDFAPVNLKVRRYVIAVNNIAN